jgi:hypothetical protein
MKVKTNLSLFICFLVVLNFTSKETNMINESLISGKMEKPQIQVSIQ